MEPLTMTDTPAAVPDEAAADPAAQAFDALRANTDAGFQAVAAQLKALAAAQTELAKSPALRQTPKQAADDLTKLVAETTARIQNEWREPTRHANVEWNELAKLTNGMRARTRQSWWLVGALLLGFASYPLLAAVTHSGRLAAWSMGHTDLWAAGNKLMQQGNPEGSAVLADAWKLRATNLDAINACKAIPAAPGRKTVCTIVLPD
jgi:hypothetical protein